MSETIDDSEKEQVTAWSSKFFVPKSFVTLVMVLLAIVLPEAAGLSFARNGAVWDGKHVSADTYLAHIELSSFQFFLIGFVPTLFFLLFFVLAVFYSKIRALKYICIAFFAVVNFLMGMAYTRLNFQNPVYVNYHKKQAYKVNAINVGIISILLIVCIVILTIIVLLILRKKYSGIGKIYSKVSCFIYIVVLATILCAAAYFTPLLSAFSAIPSQS